MAELAQSCGETVVLHGIDGPDAVVMDQALGTQHVLRVEHRPGSRHPLDAGASGWAILAFQDDRWIEKLAKKSADPAAVMARIAKTKDEGFAITHDELQMGVHGLAVPIFEQSKCVASLGILVPAGRAQNLDHWIEPLKASSREISERVSALF